MTLIISVIITVIGAILFGASTRKVPLIPEEYTRSRQTLSQDNESLFGHIFISFLSLYGYVKIQNCIRKADLTSKYSPRDLIEQFRKVYMMDLDGQMILTEVPKKIGEIEKS